MSDTPPTYPAIKAITTFGGILSWVLAIAPIVAAIWALSQGMSWLWLVPALLMGGLLYLLVRSYVEVLRILSDTLMPR